MVCLLWPRVSPRSLLFFLFFFFCGTSSLQAERHSLHYIYTGLSKPVDLPGIYDFTAMGLLDDRQIDYYNSEEKRKIPTQRWMREKMHEDYWGMGTQSRKSKEQWFNINIKILMERMRHNHSDLHVLQWRTGCEVEARGSDVRFLKGVFEYSYDGENFLSFDDRESQWVAPVYAALPTKRKWDSVPILNQYTKGYLEKECGDWLNKFREYGDEELRNGPPPDVHIFAKKSISDKTKLTLTCLATGFYHKDVMLTIRRYRRSLPDDEIESSGVRPNHDGSYQLRKSVEIKKEERDEYDCLVSQRTLERNIIVELDGINGDCSPQIQALLIGVVIGVVLMLLLNALVAYILYKNDMLGKSAKSPGSSVIDSLEEVNDGLSKLVKSGVRLDEAQIFKL